MVPVMTTTAIDADRCTGCGTCVADCPVGAVSVLRGGAGETLAATIDASCIDCGHCGAVCAVGAVVSTSGEFLQWHAPDLDREAARSFLAGRRSIRRYLPEPLAPELVADLLSVASFAPTASHAQDVSACVVTGEQVFELAVLVNGYYAWLENLLGRSYLRPLLWFTAARPYLKNPRKIESVRARVKAFDRSHDWLFFGAPVVVVLSAPRKNAMFGRTNCVIAAERIMQYAFALGVGSCWIGYAEVALRRRLSIPEQLGIEATSAIHAVFTLGRPAVEYRRLPARAPLAPAAARLPGPRHWLPE